MRVKVKQKCWWHGTLVGSWYLVYMWWYGTLVGSWYPVYVWWYGTLVSSWYPVYVSSSPFLKVGDRGLTHNCSCRCRAVCQHYLSPISNITALASPWLISASFASQLLLQLNLHSHTDIWHSSTPFRINIDTTLAFHTTNYTWWSSISSGRCAGLECSAGVSQNFWFVHCVQTCRHVTLYVPLQHFCDNVTLISACIIILIILCDLIMWLHMQHAVSDVVNVWAAVLCRSCWDCVNRNVAKTTRRS